MTRIFLFFLSVLLRLTLPLRYRVKYKGLEHLNSKTLDKPHGTLFLPNHPTVFIDPVLVVLPTFRKFKTRPVVIEYAYYGTGIHKIMKRLRALPIPDITRSRNSVKLKQNERTFSKIIDGLKEGDSFLIYPSGTTKVSGREVIGGASGVHRLVNEVPDCNVVMVRMTGLWGSSFSRALTGQAPSFFKTMAAGVKELFKNLLFFMPKREVLVEFVPAPTDFPWQAERQDFNRWLERWYNRYPTKTGERVPVEPFYSPSYKFWKNDTRRPLPTEDVADKDIDLDKIPSSTKWKVLEELGKMAKRDPESIGLHDKLAGDLALDSLDAADLLLFLEDQFSVRGVNPGDLTTVARLMGIADGQVEVKKESEADAAEATEAWFQSEGRPAVFVTEGDTVGEAFLRTCDRMGKHPALADGRSGMMTYKQLKMRALLLADVIRQMPGDSIGILLPASVVATLLMFATILAGKVPVMINWTVGPRHLITVNEVSGVEIVLTAWGFIDRLENADLTGIDEKLVFLEELRPSITLRQKLRALRWARKPAAKLVRKLGLDKIDPDSPTVMLFTSGTESQPKGVPLTHNNILENLRPSLQCIDLKPKDVVHSMLPPFHSFGFVVLGLLPVLAGVRAAFSPNPTDPQRCAFDVGKWGVTLLAGAPSFLKGLLKSASQEQLKAVRMILSGAEAAPPDLLEKIRSMGEHVTYIEGYGITECSPILTVRMPGLAEHGVGRPIPNVELLIVSENTLEPLGQGERGLILAHGPNIFNGYASSQHIEPPFHEYDGKRWYKTGDLGFIDETGCLNISGRLKRFVKIGGEMVSLLAMETALAEQAPNMGWELAAEGPSIAVCASETSDKTRFVVFTRFQASLEDLNKALRDAGFANIVKVSEVHHVQDIPLMGTGKIFYRRLEQEYNV